jgi:hypothetical protein
MLSVIVNALTIPKTVFSRWFGSARAACGVWYGFPSTRNPKMPEYYCTCSGLLLFGTLYVVLVCRVISPDLIFGSIAN